MEISDSTMILSSPVLPLKVGRVSTMLNLEFTKSGFYFLSSLYLSCLSEAAVSSYSQVFEYTLLIGFLQSTVKTSILWFSESGNMYSQRIFK